MDKTLEQVKNQAPTMAENTVKEMIEMANYLGKKYTGLESIRY